MKKAMNGFWRWLKRHGLDVCAAVIGLAILATLEARSAWAAFTLAPHGEDTWSLFGADYPRAALQHAATSILFGLAAFVCWRIAAGLKDDERPRIRARASTARIAALLCLAVPIGYLAQAGGLERQLKEREAYVASAAYKLDLDAARFPEDMGAGDARDRLQRAEAPSSGKPTGSDWAFAIFAHILVMVCAGVKTANPITHHERKAMEMEAQAKIEAAKREERNRRARERRAEKRREERGDVIPFRFGQKA